MKKKLIGFSGIVVGSMPFLALAQSGPTECANNADLNTIQGIICKVGNILDTLIPVLIVLGIVYFVWGVVSYVIGNDEEAKKKGRDRIIYGIIGLVVIVAMWGLVSIVTNTFQLNDSGTIQYPNINY